MSQENAELIGRGNDAANHNGRGPEVGGGKVLAETATGLGRLAVAAIIVDKPLTESAV
jgi:hypothetical protein